MSNSDNPEDIYKVKSGYIYNLTKFIEWPANAFSFSISPFLIGILGNKDLAFPLIKTLREKRIKDHDWKVEYYKTPDEIRHTHLIFISDYPVDDAYLLIDQLSEKDALIVADNIKDFCLLGGMINLVGHYPNYGYEVNPAALDRARFIANSDFLDLATIIR